MSFPSTYLPGLYLHSLFLQGKVGFGQGLAYVISQVIGGIAGAAFAKSILAPGLLPDPSFTVGR